MRYFIVLATILIKYGVLCKDTEAEFWSLPKLFYLDDYERCMARQDGLFCLAQFELYSDVENSPLFDLIQEKSKDEWLYNRTFLYRGYCLPTRCPDGEANATARFERCVDDTVRRRSLRARIHTLHYCRARGDPPPVASTDDAAHDAFLIVVLAILFMNAFGTFYDLWIGQKGRKNKILMMFSIRTNWLKLVAIHDVGESYRQGLKVLNGMKAVLLLGAVVAHVGVLQVQAWQYNPRFLENFMSSPAGGMLGALTTKTQTFVLISNFLTTYNVILLSEKVKITYSMIPHFFLKRVARMLPVYLLVNAFAATWWANISDGPFWPVLVGTESQICREKFWAQAFFLNNVFHVNKICNVQTWVMAIDMQLFAPSLLIVVWILKTRRRAILTLLGLLALVTALTTYVALKNQYTPAFYYMTPEAFRTMLFECRIFTELFLQPISCMITMVLGILLGFMYYNLQKNAKPKDEKNENVQKTKPTTTLIVIHHLALPMVFVWSYVCWMLIPYNDPVFAALLVPVERLAHATFGLAFIYTSTKVKSYQTEILAWKGLRVVSRVALSLSMVHWCVNKSLVANRSILLDASQGTLLVDTIAVAVISFLLAIPLTVLVEYPLSKTLDKLLMFLIRK